MPLTRRAMLGLTLASALWPLARPGEAQRFVNRTGLRPGRFIWEPTKSAEGPVLIIVSLGEQIAHVYRGGAAIGISTCSAGRRGHRTPTGVFTILRKARRPAASRSKGVRRPARERLIWSGIALHAHHVLGYPASYGCVRLPLEFSALLYDVSPLGMTVIIADEHTQAGEVVDPGILLPALAEDGMRPGENAGEDRRACPRLEATVKAPVHSIIVSRADAKARVMRNGVVEIETRVTISEPHKRLGTHVYSLLGRDGNGKARRWLAFGIAREKSAAHLTTWRAPAPLSRIAFAQPECALAAARALHAGTTLIITDAAGPPTTRWTPDGFVVVATQTPEPRRRPAARRAPRLRDRPDDPEDRDEPESLHPESPR
jgi:hypothetical protein